MQTDNPIVRDLLDKARNAPTMAEAVNFYRKARMEAARG